jgi:hypothetical protein
MGTRHTVYQFLRPTSLTSEASEAELKDQGLLCPTLAKERLRPANSAVYAKENATMHGLSANFAKIWGSNAATATREITARELFQQSVSVSPC